MQVLSLKVQPQCHCLRFFLLQAPISGTRESVFYSFFLTAICHASINSLFFYLFLQKIRCPILFSTKWLLLTLTGKFISRNSCGYCFRHFDSSKQGLCLPKWTLYGVLFVEKYILGDSRELLQCFSFGRFSRTIFGRCYMLCYVFFILIWREIALYMKI